MGASQQGQTGQMNLTPDTQGVFEALSKVMQRQDSATASTTTSPSTSSGTPGGLPDPMQAWKMTHPIGASMKGGKG